MKAIYLWSAYGHFTFQVKQRKQLFTPGEAIELIKRFAKRYDISPKALAQYVGQQERSIRKSLIPFVETINDNYEQVHERRVKMVTDGMPKWKVLSKKRADRLWRAYHYFVDQSLHDLCYIPYDQQLPEPEMVLKRIRHAAEKHDVDPDYLFPRIVQHFFPDWHILIADYSPIYQNLYKFFEGE